jgi:cysteine-rich repeat protein
MLAATRRIHFLATTFCLAMFGTQPVEAQTEVNTCGQVLAGDGFLAANLDCTGFPNVAVTMSGSKPTFNLRGFTLTGGETHAIECLADCTVFSTVPGGTLLGSASASTNRYGISSNGNDVTIDGITISGHERGINAIIQLGKTRVTVRNSLVTLNNATALFGGKVDVRDSMITNNGNQATQGDKITLRNVEIAGNLGSGAIASKVKARDCTITGNGGGILNSNVVIVKNCEVSGQSGAGVGGNKVKVLDSEVSGNASGVSGAKIAIKNSTVSDNAANGISGNGANVIVKGTTVSGNGFRGISIITTKKKLKISKSVVTANARSGVFAERDEAGHVPPTVSVKNSFVTGNGVDAGCGVDAIECVDIETRRRPAFEYIPGVNECETSLAIGNASPNPSWAMCELDCGNGVTNPGEDCDDAGESLTCDLNCTLPSCGDGDLNATRGEQCDDGNNDSDDGCDATCIVEYCGDGISQPGIGETCDDAGESATCDANCTPAECGDNTTNMSAGEECDGFSDSACEGMCDVTCQCP